MIVYESNKFGEVWYSCMERDGAYIYENKPGYPGTMGRQIGTNGYRGDMLDCDGTFEGLRKVVLAWRRKFKNMIK